MRRKFIIFALIIITMTVMSGGFTYALFSAQSPRAENTFRAAVVDLSTTGALDFDSQTQNLAPGESPEAHTDSIALNSSSTIATKLYVTFAIDDLQLGPPLTGPLAPYSLAEGLVIDRIEYIYGGTSQNIAAGITNFDELVNDGVRVATYYLGDIPANDTTSKQLVFKWHFPNNGTSDNRYQGASFRLNYYFTAEQVH